MIPDKVPKEDVFYGSGDWRKDAHVPSFDKYKELYRKSIENPDGECSLCSFSLQRRTPVTGHLHVTI